MTSSALLLLPPPLPATAAPGSEGHCVAHSVALGVEEKVSEVVPLPAPLRVGTDHFGTLVAVGTEVHLREGARVPQQGRAGPPAPVPGGAVEETEAVEDEEGASGWWPWAGWHPPRHHPHVGVADGATGEVST